MPSINTLLFSTCAPMPPPHPHGRDACASLASSLAVASFLWILGGATPLAWALLTSTILWLISWLTTVYSI
jgi:hypothetical protein